MSLFIIFLAVLIGLTLGILGGGGSILTVPVLTYVVGVEPRMAIPMSLLIVGITAAFSTLLHHRRGHVNWRMGLVFAPAAMMGGMVGGWGSRYFSESFLLLSFAALMVLTGVGMLRKRPTGDSVTVRSEGSLSIILLEGSVVGAVTGLVGAGGGFLVVPALLLWGGLSMRDAVGTSLLIISLKSFAAFSGHMSHVAVDWSGLLVISGGALLGSILGGFIGPKLPTSILKKGFSFLVLAMAGWIVFREAGPGWLLAGLILLVGGISYDREAPMGNASAKSPL